MMKAFNKAFFFVSKQTPVDNQISRLELNQCYYSSRRLGTRAKDYKGAKKVRSQSLCPDLSPVCFFTYVVFGV